jgi:hypothetical protein
MRKPSTDYNALSHGLRGLPLFREVDLSTARSIAAGTAMEIIAAGNTFYADPLVDAAGLPIGGVATVHFQDLTLGPGNTPFTIYPQAIMNIPFTRLLIENPAQAGKKMRFIFGVDLAFSPGINANVSIVGSVATTTTDTPSAAPGASFIANAGLASNAPEVVILPAANLNGLIVHSASIWTAHVTAASTSQTALIAKTSAPANGADGEMICFAGVYCQTAAGILSAGAQREKAYRVAAGKGLYFYQSGGATEHAAKRSCAYTLL